MSENRHDKMPSHNIDDLFRSAIEPLDDSPPPAVWENLEKDLDRYNVISIKKKYNNLKRVAVAMVLILSSALIYEYQTHGSGKSNYSVFKTITNSKHNTIEGEADNSHHNKLELKNDLQKSSAEQPVTPETFIPESPISKSLTGVQSQAAIETNKDLASTQQSLKDQPATNQAVSQNFTAGVVRKGGVISAAKSRLSYIYSEATSQPTNILHDGYSPVIKNEKVERSLYSRLPLSLALNNGDAIFATKLGDAAINISNANQLLAVKNKVIGESNIAKQAIKLSGKKAPRFSLSLVFSPDFTSRVIKEDWLVNREDNKDEIRKSERYAFSYSFGALGDYNISKHWAIQSGFTLSRAVINIDPKFIFARRDEVGDVKYKFNSSAGYSFFSPHTMSLPPAFGDSLHAFGSSSALLYVSVPVAVKYKIASKKIDFYATAGIAANILVKDKIETSLFKGSSHEKAINHDIRGLKPVYYSALLGAGASYKISRTLAVNFTPTARISLNSINKDGPVKSYQQSLGMVTGLQLSF